MNMSQAFDIIQYGMQRKKGYMVSFEHSDGRFLNSDYFPNKNAGEALIATEAEAWHLARLFAAQTNGRCVNIYVMGSDFSPVPGYEKQLIKNR